MRNTAISLYFLSIPCFSAPLEISILDNDGRPVEDVVVYVTATNLPNETDPPEDLVTEISQENRAFRPYVSVVRVNQPVLFTNKDDISHHVYSIAGPLDFSFVIGSEESGVSKSFPSEGVVGVGCNIHDWMSGYIKVVDTPYYSITGTSGRVKMTLPDNIENAEVIAWHPQMNEVLKTGLGEQTSITLSLAKEMSPIPKQKNSQMIDFYGKYR